MAEGSGRWATLAEEFVENGTTIKWGALGTLVVGSFYTEVVLGVLEVVASWVGTNVALLGALGSGLATLLERLAFIPISAAYTAWASAASALFGGWLGAGAPVFAVGLVLVVIYLYQEATINRVTGWFGLE